MPILLGVGMMLSAAPVYTVTVTVPAGVTNTLAEALSAGYAKTDGGETVSALEDLCLAGDLVKAGEGRLDLPCLTNELSTLTFTGEIHVAQGVLRLTENGALGTSDAGTFVADGATLETFTTTAHYFKIIESITIAGTGATGEGAFISRSTVPQGYLYSAMDGRSVWGGPLSLSADATVRAFSETEFFSQSRQNYHVLNLNGHTLTLCGIGGRLHYYAKGPGTILFGEDTREYFFIETMYDNVLPATLCVSNAVKTQKFKLTNYTFSGIPWTWQFLTPAQIAFEGNNPNATWGGPAIVDAPVFFATPYPFTFSKAVSGNGSLLLSKGATVTLAASGSFTGDISVDASTIALLVGDAVSENAKPITVTNGTVRLSATAPGYRLPALEVTGTGLVTQASGSWKSVVKRGAGELRYESSLETGPLDIQGGTVTMPDNAVSFNAGLYEGYRNNYDTWYSSDTSLHIGNNTTDGYYSRMCWTNEADAVHLSPRYATSAGANNFKRCTVVTYTGYICNPSAETVKMSFLLGTKTVSQLFIDGGASGSQLTGAALRKTYSLTPGCHQLEFRIAGTGGDIGPNGVGHPLSGLAWKLGDASDNVDDYTPLADDGTGSFLTLTIPDSDAYVALAAAVRTSRIRTFPRLSGQPGTVLNVRGMSVRAEELVGCLTINQYHAALSNATTFVDASYTVSAADVLDGNHFGTDGLLSFADEAQIVIENGTSLQNGGTVVVAEAARGILGKPEIIGSDGAKFHVVLSQDGTTLSAEFVPSGTVLIFR